MKADVIRQITNWWSEDIMKQASVGQRHFTGQDEAGNVRYHNGKHYPRLYGERMGSPHG
jgi:hypothetical protein